MTTNPNVQPVVEDIVQTLEDGRKGFDDGADKLASAGHHDLAEVFRQFSVQRGKFSAELHNAAGAYGVHIQHVGSLAGSLHRGWMALTGALTGHDPDTLLGTAVEGEDYALAQYDDALARAEFDFPPDLRDMLVRQYAAVRVARDELRSKRRVSA